jgi:hypothetical protein
MIQPVSRPKPSQEYHRVEKIIKEKEVNGTRWVLVRWLLYGQKHDEWMEAANLKGSKDIGDHPYL